VTACSRPLRARGESIDHRPTDSGGVLTIGIGSDALLREIKRERERER